MQVVIMVLMYLFDTCFYNEATLKNMYSREIIRLWIINIAHKHI